MVSLYLRYCHKYGTIVFSLHSDQVILVSMGNFPQNSDLVNFSEFLIIRDLFALRQIVLFGLSVGGQLIVL